MVPSLSRVSEFMTSGPYSIGPHEPLPNALSLMREHDLRHLPVWEHGKLVGIVSKRDVDFVQALVPEPRDVVTVEDAMTPEPYAPSPDTPLVEVVRVMADRKIGSAVVVDAGRIVGVFTVSDAMRALVDLLEGKAQGSLEPRRPPSPARRPAPRRRSVT